MEYVPHDFRGGGPPGLQERVMRFRPRQLGKVDRAVDWQRSGKGDTYSIPNPVDTTPLPSCPFTAMLRDLSLPKGSPKWQLNTKRERAWPDVKLATTSATGGHVDGKIIRPFTGSDEPQWNPSLRSEPPQYQPGLDANAAHEQNDDRERTNWSTRLRGENQQTRVPPTRTSRKDDSLSSTHRASGRTKPATSAPMQKSKRSLDRLAGKSNRQARVQRDDVSERVVGRHTRSRATSQPHAAPRESRAPSKGGPLDEDELGPNSSIRKHAFRDFGTPGGREKWEHRLTKAGSALDKLPPAPGGTSDERLARFKTVAKVRRRTEPTMPAFPEIAAATDGAAGPADSDLESRPRSAKPSIAHLPQNERLGIRLDEASEGRPARELRRKSSLQSLDQYISDAGSPSGEDSKSNDSLRRWRQIQKKLNKERF